MEHRSRPVAARLPREEFNALERDTEATGLNKNNALRTYAARGRALNLLTISPEQFESEADLIRQHRANLAKFKGLAGPVLVGDWNVANEIHAHWILTEQAGDNPGFVLSVVSAFERGEDFESLLKKNNESFFNAPKKAGVEYYELHRHDLISLELRRNKAIGTPQREYVAYVTAGVDRANIRERWLWHRRLLSELALAGVDYRSLFKWSESDHMFRLVDRPRLREAYEGGRLTLEFGDPITPPRSRAPARRPLPNPLQGKTMDGSDA